MCQQIQVGEGVHRVLPDSSERRQHGHASRQQGRGKAAIWEVWYFGQRSIPPQLQKQQGLRQRGRKDALAVPCWLMCRNADTLIIRGLPMNFSRETEE